MNFKRHLLFAFFSLFCEVVCAQEQNVFFLKNNGQHVSVRDSADFIRIISLPDSGSKFFNIKEYYKNGKLKLTGKTRYNDNSLLEGTCIAFYQSGKRKQMADYKNGSLINNEYNYYPNGALYCIKRHYIISKANNIYSDFTVITCRDSTGKAMVTDSSGYYIGYNESFKTIYEEGSFKNGKRDGDWKGSGNETDSIILFNEKYDNGKLITGTSKDVSGKVYNYEQREIKPEFDGGENAFGSFLQRNIHYPDEDKNKRKTGRVFINFNIEKNGSIANVNSSVYPTKSLALEGIRVLTLSSGSWLPGLRFGKPTVVEFTVPINFSLAD